MKRKFSLVMSAAMILSLIAPMTNGLPDKFGLAHTIRGKPGGKVGVFFIGQPGLDYPAAVGHVISFHRWLTSFLCVVSSH